MGGDGRDGRHRFICPAKNPYVSKTFDEPLTPRFLGSNGNFLVRDVFDNSIGVCLFLSFILEDFGYNIKDLSRNLKYFGWNLDDVGRILQDFGRNLQDFSPNIKNFGRNFQNLKNFGRNLLKFGRNL